MTNKPFTCPVHNEEAFEAWTGEFICVSCMQKELEYKKNGIQPPIGN